MQLFGVQPTLIGLAVAIFLIIVFAKYGGVKKKAERGFNLLAGGGLFFVLAATFPLLSVWKYILEGDQLLYPQYLFEVIGWVFALVGIILVGLDVIQKR